MAGERWPTKARKDCKGEELEVFDQIAEMSKAMFGDKFTYTREDGAPLGPFAAFLYTPAYSKALLPAVQTINDLDIQPNIKEIVILGTGSDFLAPYEMYAHERVAEKGTKLSKEEIVAIKNGKKPPGLTEEEGVAFDLSRALAKGGGPLEEGLWNKAVQLLGKEQTLAAAHFVGMYSYVSILLNVANVPLPEGEELYK